MLPAPQRPGIYFFHAVRAGCRAECFSIRPNEMRRPLEPHLVGDVLYGMAILQQAQRSLEAQLGDKLSHAHPEAFANAPLNRAN
jgi:hypothetical protein